MYFYSNACSCCPWLQWLVVLWVLLLGCGSSFLISCTIACPIAVMFAAISYINIRVCCCACSNEGKSLLVLMPSELKMLPALTTAKIPLKQITINPKHATAATAKVRSEVAADAELKELAQKSFKSYIKSVSLQPNKDVFTAEGLPLDAYAEVPMPICMCSVDCVSCTGWAVYVYASNALILAAYEPLWRDRPAAAAPVHLSRAVVVLANTFKVIIACKCLISHGCHCKLYLCRRLGLLLHRK